MKIWQYLSKRGESLTIFFILFVGLINGGLYTFIVPPWQHYDEPAHFEYAWLIANQGKLPEANSSDSEMRREVAASMVEHNFFDTLAPPNLLLENTWIGISQTRDQSLYYLIAAIPLWLLKGSDVAFQLYSVRLVSLIMFLVTILVANKLSGDIFPENKSLSWMIPTSIALTPAFVDIMTAINNDVGAVLAFSIFLWLGARIIVRGITLMRVIVFLMVTGVCFYTKTTVFIAIPMAIFLFLFSMFQVPYPWKLIAIPATLGSIFLAGLFSLTKEDAAFWYRNQYTVQQNVSTRSQQNVSSSGKHAFLIQFNPSEKNELALFQPLDNPAISALSGKDFTLGAWIWASEPVQAQMLTLWVDGTSHTQAIQLEQMPAFFSLTGKIPDDTNRIQVVIDPLTTTPDHQISVYFDNILLINGDYRLAGIPELTEEGRQGKWGNREFLNLIRNPSAEKTWFTFKPPLLLQFSTQTSIPVYALPAMQDLQLTSGIYRNTIKNLFESFWARFGWNHVTLSQPWYVVLQWFTIISLGISTFVFFRLKSWSNTKIRIIMGWFAICALLIWVAALARQNLPFWNFIFFTPSARYAFPAIIPSMILIIGGWSVLPTFYPRLKAVSYFPILFLSILDVISIITIFHFYYSR